MYYTGFADEASSALREQIACTKALGWKHLDARNLDGGNILDVSEREFFTAVELLENEDVKVSCIGSTIGKKGLDEDFEIALKQTACALERMKRLNTRYIRVMSWKSAIPGGAHSQNSAIIMLC